MIPPEQAPVTDTPLTDAVVGKWCNVDMPQELIDLARSLERRLSAWQPGHPPKDAPGTILVANAKGQIAPRIRGIIHNNIGTANDWHYGEAITHWMPLDSLPPVPSKEKP